MFDVPILIAIYNREDVTLEMYKILEKIKPKYLYINADGPKLNNKLDEVRCNNTRSIFLNLKWDCDIKYNFSSYNKGCKLSVSEGITWFFNDNEYGIILEDDCIPNVSFFYYCKELLELYKNDNRIFHINGTNFLGNEQLHITDSYSFTKFVSIWGWATWRRSWLKYDLKMTNFPDFSKNKLDSKSFSIYAKHHYYKSFEDIYFNNINSWSTQWIFTIYFHNGFTITPNCNLVSNIGTQNNPTHKFLLNRFRDFLNTKELTFPLIHPKFTINHKIDRLNFKNYRGKNLVKLFYFLKDNKINIVILYFVKFLKNRKFY
jgi:hypothetical protein